MSNAPHPTDPAVMNGVIPYLLMVGRAAEACDFYARAFGAKGLGRMPFPDGKPGLIHAQIEINGGALMMTDEARADAREALQSVQLVVADGQAWWDRAVAAGCRVLAPYERQFWGDDRGLLEDPFGLKWAVLQPAAPA